MNVAIFFRFAVVWMVLVLDYGWVVSSWYRFNLPGAMFSCISLVSATSSYADDIAHIKILYGGFPQPRGRGVRFLFLLKMVLTFCRF